MPSYSPVLKNAAYGLLLTLLAGGLSKKTSGQKVPRTNDPCPLKWVSHRSYVVLRTDRAELPYAVRIRWPTWQYAEGRKRVRKMDAKKKMFSTQFYASLRNSTLLFVMLTQ